MPRTRDPLRNFEFTVQIEGFNEELGFSMVDGLSFETEVVEYREGGNQATVRKMPGLATFENIILERGKYAGTTAEGADDMTAWMDQVYNHDNGLNQLQTGFRRNVVITQRDRGGVPVRQWRVFHAWPCRYENEPFEGDGSDVLIQRLEICHEGFKEDNLQTT